MFFRTLLSDLLNKNRIDFILINRNYKNIVSNCCMHPSAYYRNDRVPLTIRCKLKLKNEK